MRKSSFDTRVKKTLVRHSEQNAPSKSKVVHDFEIRDRCEGSLPSTQKVIDLGQPTICSSEVFANYLNDVKKCLPPLIAADLHAHPDKTKLNANVRSIYKLINWNLNWTFYVSWGTTITCYPVQTY